MVARYRMSQDVRKENAVIDLEPFLLLEGENTLRRHGLGSGHQAGYQPSGLTHEFLHA
jgi:hypothetical protein